MICSLKIQKQMMEGNRYDRDIVKSFMKSKE